MVGTIVSWRVRVIIINGQSCRCQTRYAPAYQVKCAASVDAESSGLQCSGPHRVGFMPSVSGSLEGAPAHSKPQTSVSCYESGYCVFPAMTRLDGIPNLIAPAWFKFGKRYSGP